MITVHVDGHALSVNGVRWIGPPSTSDFYAALGCSDEFSEGDAVIIEGKMDSRYRYLDQAGISILESVPEELVRRLVVNFQAPASQARKSEMKKRLERWGAARFRNTTNPFTGVLHLNGKALRSPLTASRFPLKGDLNFVHQAAFGNRICTSVTFQKGYVLHVNIEFSKRRILQFE